MYKLDGPFPDQSEQWRRLYLRRAVLADMRHLTQFCLKYGGKTNTFASVIGYAIPRTHSGKNDSPREPKSRYIQAQREIFLLGFFHGCDFRLAGILAAMVFTTFNRGQRLPTLTEFTVYPLYKRHATVWAEQIMKITLREFVQRSVCGKALSWADIGEFVSPFVHFGVQAGEPRIFSTLWKELFASSDEIDPILDYTQAGKSPWMHPTPLASSPTDCESSQNPETLRMSCGTPAAALEETIRTPALLATTIRPPALPEESLQPSASPESSMRLPGCESLSSEAWERPFWTENMVERCIENTAWVKPLPTLEPEPIIAFPCALTLKPDFGAGRLP